MNENRRWLIKTMVAGGLAVGLNALEGQIPRGFDRFFNVLSDKELLQRRVAFKRVFSSPSATETPKPSPTVAQDKNLKPEIRFSPEDILKMFTDPYPNPENATGLSKTRVLRITKDTSPQMIATGQRGDLFFSTPFAKLLCEMAFQREAVPHGDLYVTHAASAIVRGLKKSFPDKTRPLVVGLEAGHMSNPPAGMPTLDTGTAFGNVSEKSLNHRTCELAAKKIGEDPQCANWIVIMNSKKEGFPVERLEKDGEYAGINHQDGILPMNLLYNLIGEQFRKIGADMVVFSIHHNDAGDQSLRGGYIYTPDRGSYKTRTEEIGNILVPIFAEEINQAIPGYVCRIQTTPKFYWILDVYDGDNPEDVKSGKLETVNGFEGANYGCVSNIIAAKLRRNYLGEHPAA